MKTYKGIEISNTNKQVQMAHSRFTETNKGIDELTTLLNRPKANLTSQQFYTISALSSVCNANYQICNGGLDQYYWNQYDEGRDPFNEEDVAHLDKEEQVDMMRELLTFGRTIFPERATENDQLERIISDFDAAHYETNIYDNDDEDNEVEDGLCAPWDFDQRYFQVNTYLEMLMELYAQYLNRRYNQETN